METIKHHKTEVLTSDPDIDILMVLTNSKNLQNKSVVEQD